MCGTRPPVTRSAAASRSACGIDVGPDPDDPGCPHGLAIGACEARRLAQESEPGRWDLISKPLVKPLDRLALQEGGRHVRKLGPVGLADVEDVPSQG